MEKIVSARAKKIDNNNLSPAQALMYLQEETKKNQELIAKQNNQILDRLANIDDWTHHIHLAIADNVPKKGQEYNPGQRRIPVSTPTRPSSPEQLTDGTTPGYVSENVNDVLGRNSYYLYIINFGPGDLDVIYASIADVFSANEYTIPEGGTTVFKNVYEARLRAPIAGLLYQITETEVPLQSINIVKGEKLEVYRTLSTVDFNGAIPFRAQQTANITGLVSNKYFIRNVNIQSILPLKYRLYFWSRDTFDDPGDLDSDSFLGFVDLNLSAGFIQRFRINGTGQFRLDITSLDVLYEDDDQSNELHVSLQNLSPTTKPAGPAGGVQIDFFLSPRV